MFWFRLSLLITSEETSASSCLFEFEIVKHLLFVESLDIINLLKSYRLGRLNFSVTQLIRPRKSETGFSVIL